MSLSARETFRKFKLIYCQSEWRISFAIAEETFSFDQWHSSVWHAKCAFGKRSTALLSAWCTSHVSNKHAKQIDLFVLKFRTWWCRIYVDRVHSLCATAPNATHYGVDYGTFAAANTAQRSVLQAALVMEVFFAFLWCSVIHNTCDWLIDWLMYVRVSTITTCEAKRFRKISFQRILRKGDFRKF